MLNKTLSEHGTVSRGVCGVDANSNLVEINERTKIYRKDGVIIYEDAGIVYEVPENSSVSMNFWCFHPAVFEVIGQLFAEFPKNNMDNLKAEFFIPIVADHFIKNGGSIIVLPTSAQWFGVTYKEDAPGVKKSIDTLISNGEYPAKLF